MEKTIYSSQTVDLETGEVKSSKVITKKKLTTESFIQTYTQDLGVLLKCTKGQIDLLICLMNLGFVEFNTNEVILTAARRKQVADCANIKQASIYNSVNGLKNKSIIIEDNYGKQYLNPKLFFYGYEIEREKVLKLTLSYHLK